MGDLLQLKECLMEYRVCERTERNDEKIERILLIGSEVSICVKRRTAKEMALEGKHGNRPIKTGIEEPPGWA